MDAADPECKPSGFHHPTDTHTHASHIRKIDRHQGKRTIGRSPSIKCMQLIIAHFVRSAMYYIYNHALFLAVYADFVEFTADPCVCNCHFLGFNGERGAHVCSHRAGGGRAGALNSQPSATHIVRSSMIAIHFLCVYVRGVSQCAYYNQFPGGEAPTHTHPVSQSL